MNRRQTIAIGLIGLSLLTCAGLAVAGHGQPENLPRTGLADLKVVFPAVPCSELVHAQIPMLADAAIHIAKAVEVQDGGPAPYCQVTGSVSPEVHF